MKNPLITTSFLLFVGMLSFAQSQPPVRPPVQSQPAQNAPAQNVPVQNAPAQNAPAQNAVQAAPAQSVRDPSTQTTPITAPKFTPAPNAVFWFIFGAMTLVIAVGLLSIGKLLRKDKDWTFADALSEPDGKPSSSRLIAFLGFLIMIAVILGIGYSSLWVFLQTGQLPTLSGATTFLVACAGLFAPYLVNQISQAVGSPATPQALAPVVVQSANSALQFGPTSLPVTFGAPRPPVGV